jgi:hypothetical protein
VRICDVLGSSGGLNIFPVDAAYVAAVRERVRAATTVHSHTAQVREHQCFSVVHVQNHFWTGFPRYLPSASCACIRVQVSKAVADNRWFTKLATSADIILDEVLCATKF